MHSCCNFLPQRRRTSALQREIGIASSSTGRLRTLGITRSRGTQIRVAATEVAAQRAAHAVVLRECQELKQ